MTTISGQIKGYKLLDEGYLKDSTGRPIEPEAWYNYEGIAWCGLDRIWNASGHKPRKFSPPIKKNEQ